MSGLQGRTKRSFLVLLAVLTVGPLSASAHAAQAPVGLGTAAPFAVLSGSAVTNTGPSVLNGDLGLSPGTAVTGFPPGTVNGATHIADAVAAQAQADSTAAYDDVASRTPSATVSGDLGGSLFKAGVYKSSSSLLLTGDVTLDAENDPGAVFIFQVGSSLTTASNSRVLLINGATPCNVYWQIGSSATFGTATSFSGTVLALTSITANTNAVFGGQLFARNGAVTLDTNTITRSTCAAASNPPTPTSPSGTSPSGAPTTPGATSPGATPVTPTAGTCCSARLTGPPTTTGSRCVGGRFRAKVTGRGIRRVIFTYRGKTLGDKKKGPFQVWVSVTAGTHTLRARVTFTNNKHKNLKLVFHSCAGAQLKAGVTPLTG